MLLEPLAAASIRVSALLASPEEIFARYFSASASKVAFGKPLSDSSARFMIDRTSASFNGSSFTTTDLEINGVITLNEGFSVVAAISVMIPDSTAFNSESCWDFENR